MRNFTRIDRVLTAQMDDRRIMQKRMRRGGKAALALLCAATALQVIVPASTASAALRKKPTKSKTTKSKTGNAKVSTPLAAPVAARPDLSLKPATQGTESFTLTLGETYWERAEKPSLQIAWSSYGPKLDGINIVAVSSLGDAPVTLRAAAGNAITIAGLNPYANITIQATPLWQGFGNGVVTTLVVPAGATGPHPKNAHPEALKGVKLTGERPNPCVPIHWKYNAARQGFDALPAVSEAMRSLGAATGIEVIYDGLSDDYDNSGPTYNLGTVDQEHPRTYLLVQWEDPNRPVKNDPDTPEKIVLGVGSAGFRRGRPGLPEDFADGASVTLRKSASLNDPTIFRTTILHELGHAVGLDHVDDATSIMYPITNGVTDWSASDRASLAALGRPGAEVCYA
jgi:Matrixin